MDVTPYVESVRRCEAELKRRNAEATQQARGDLPGLIEVLRADPRIRKAYLFGSLAKGKFHPKSDIDLAVEGLEWNEIDRLRAALQSLTRFGVDVRDLDDAPRFRALIEFYGELLYAQP